MSEDRGSVTADEFFLKEQMNARLRSGMSGHLMSVSNFLLGNELGAWISSVKQSYGLEEMPLFIGDKLMPAGKESPPGTSEVVLPFDG